MNYKTLTAILLLAACSGGNDDQETFGTEASTTTQDTDGSNDDDGVGTGSEEADSESEGGDGDGTGDSGDGDGDDTGDEVGDGDGDESTTSVSTGDGDGDSGDGDSGTGEMKFPGDPCDPFDDMCIEDYGCDVLEGITETLPEFRCRLQFYIPNSVGEYGQPCQVSQHCNEGLKCEEWDQFPEGDCGNESTKCCIDLCVYEEVCDSGVTCSVTWWPADLEDYLDDYTGIGICAST